MASKAETAPSPDPEVTGEVLADLLGLTEKRIRQLAAEGMPKNGPGRYPLRACIRWHVDYWKAKAIGGPLAESFHEARRRKLAAEAAVKEAELGKLRGELLPADEVRRAWECALAALRATFRGLPARLAPAVAAADDLGACRELLLRAVDEALEELSHAEPVPLAR